MTHELYSETDNWEIESPDQDVRGWNVVDERGQQVGTVTDMYVDTQTETIDRLILDNGSEIDVSTVLVDEGTIRVGGMGGTSSSTDRQEMSGAATADRADTDDTWRIRRHEEDLQATKQRQQTGEVQINTDTERVSDTVRREEFDIENQGDVSVRENRDR